jgi:hypothetical protein
MRAVGCRAPAPHFASSRAASHASSASPYAALNCSCVITAARARACAHPCPRSPHAPQTVTRRAVPARTAGSADTRPGRCAGIPISKFSCPRAGELSQRPRLPRMRCAVRSIDPQRSSGQETARLSITHCAKARRRGRRAALASPGQRESASARHHGASSVSGGAVRFSEFSRKRCPSGAASYGTTSRE